MRRRGTPGTGKPAVVDVFDTVTVPAGAVFPYRLPKLCVYAMLRGGGGGSMSWSS